MLTFWIIVLSLGLLSMLVPPFFNFISKILMVPITLILTPFAALADNIKKKRTEKFGQDGEVQWEEQMKMYISLWFLTFIILGIILLFIEESDVLPHYFYSNVGSTIFFVFGIPAIISSIIVLITWLFSRHS